MKTEQIGDAFHRQSAFRAFLARISTIAACGFATATYAQLATSAFTSDTEEWRVIDRNFNTLEVIGQRESVYHSSGGNPGGFIELVDGPGDCYFRAPAKFLGNKVSAYGHSLQFDVISDQRDTPADLIHGVILIGNGITNVAPPVSLTFSNTWCRLSVLIEANGNWTNAATGLPSSVADLTNCLSHLESLDIVGEFGEGPDTTGLDNVILFGDEPRRLAIWERKAHGEEYLVQCRPDDPIATNHWPNNMNWSQDEHWALLCGEPYTRSVMTQPSNWTTTNYPNGLEYDVIVGGAGGEPVEADIPVAINSLTIETNGSITFGHGGVAANTFDFRADADTSYGYDGYGSYYLYPMHISEGGRLTASAGTNTLSIEVPASGGANVGVSVHSGTLRFTEGDNSVIWTNWTFQIDAGAAFDFDLWADRSAWLYVNGTLSGSGAGQFLFNSGFMHTPGATLNFPESMFQWTYGWIGDTYEIYTNLGTINAVGPFQEKQLGGICYNSGDLIFSGGGALAFGSFYNLTSGTLDIRTDTARLLSGTIINSGVVRKSGGVGTNTVLAQFQNVNGTLTVESGTLALTGYVDMSGGNFVVSQGSKLDLTSGSYSSDYAGSFTGSGGGSVLLSGGTLRAGAGGVILDFPGTMFQWTGGSLFASHGQFYNAGVINAGGPAIKTISVAYLTNAGLFTVAGEGSVYCNFAAPHNLSGGTIEIHSDADFTGNRPLVNEGWVRKLSGGGVSVVQAGMVNQNGNIRIDAGSISLGAGEYVQGNGELTLGISGRAPGQCGNLIVSGHAHLSGPLTVNLLNGFQLATGDRFELLSCAARIGGFSSATLPAGTSIEYTGTGAFLVVTSPLPVLITGPTKIGQDLGFSFRSLANQSYTVEYNDDLRTAHWTFCTNLMGNGSAMDVLLPATNSMHRFFRVRQP